MAKIMKGAVSMELKEQMKSSDCYCINLRRAANAITTYYDAALSETGITLCQYSILSNIRKIQPCSVAELSRRMRLERTTLVRNLKGMYASGWIYDESDHKQRCSRICLSQSGIDVICAAKPAWKQAQCGIEALLSEEELLKLTHSLLLLEKMVVDSKRQPKI